MRHNGMVMMMLVCMGWLFGGVLHFTGSEDYDFMNPNNYQESTTPAEGDTVIINTGVCRIYDWLDFKVGSILIFDPYQSSTPPALTVWDGAHLAAGMINVGGLAQQGYGSASFSINNSSFLKADIINVDDYGTFWVQGGRGHIGELNFLHSSGSAVIGYGHIRCNSIDNSVGSYIGYKIMGTEDIGSIYVLYGGSGDFYNPMDIAEDGEVTLQDYAFFARNWLDGVEPMEMMTEDGGEEPLMVETEAIEIEESTPVELPIPDPNTIYEIITELEAMLELED